MTARTASVLPEPVARALDALWTTLPLALAIGVVGGAIWQFTRVTPVTVWPALVLILPLLVALVSCLDDALDGARTGFAALVRRLPRATVSTLALLGPALGSSLLTAAAFAAATRSGSAWMLVSVGAGLAVTVGLTALGLVAAPIALIDRAGPGAAWRSATRLFLAAPLPAMGPVAGLVLVATIASHAAYPVLLLLPAVWAPLWIASLRAARRRAQQLGRLA